MGTSGLQSRWQEGVPLPSGDKTTGLTCSIKLPFRASEALELESAQRTGYGLGKSGWVTFTFSAKSKVPMTKMLDWLDESWRAVAPAKLSATHPAPKVPKRRKAT